MPPYPETEEKYLPKKILLDAENKSIKSANVVLEYGMRDILSATSHLDGHRLTQIDTLLRENNAPTLTQVRMEYSSKYKKIINSNELKNEKQYYIAKSVLEDTKIGSTEERETLLKLVSEYEKT